MLNKLNFEKLEDRIVLTASDILADYVDVSQLEVEAVYTTFDSPANHVTSPGTQWDGIVKLTMVTNLGTFLGSGTLLPSGRHILTAAHNVTGADDQQFTHITSITALFELPTGPVPRSVSLTGIQVHPNWDPDNLTAGADIAILELTSWPAPQNLLHVL